MLILELERLTIPKQIKSYLKTDSYLILRLYLNYANGFSWLLVNMTLFSDHMNLQVVKIFSTDFAVKVFSKEIMSCLRQDEIKLLITAFFWLILFLRTIGHRD